MAGLVAIIGGRQLSPAAAAHVQALAAQLAGRGFTLVTGCCTGADQAVIAAALVGTVPVEALQVLAAFGPGGQGACPVSAVAAVEAFAAGGGAVSWWAGGGPGVPLRARLAGRAAQVINSAASVVAMHPGRGSWRACRLAAARGLPVVVFSASPVSLGAGHWQPVCAGSLWSSAQRWMPRQAAFSL
ncbi:hypothetical protein [Halomonas tibetensis]|uniref:Smf/DprA SLOG domain-containing protein n=1 Tax=Halomonas tibetensis TaxID=2259590 RepID=A0ABV7B682_9GAMM